MGQISRIGFETELDNVIIVLHFVRRVSGKTVPAPKLSIAAHKSEDVGEFTYGKRLTQISIAFGILPQPSTTSFSVCCCRRVAK